MMIFQALLLHKNYSSATLEISQSNAGCSEEECAVETASLSYSEEGTSGHGDPLPRPQPHMGPCRCLHDSFELLKKRRGASSGPSRVQSIALFP